jgi:hypothetical protein
MTLSEEQIEWIVQEVLRRLGVAAGNGDTKEGVAVGQRSSTTVEPREMTLSERVITLRSLENRLSGITKVVVGAKAVVTPAVRDELNAKKIQLIRKG